MNPVAKMAAFVVVLAVLFALGLGLGRIVGPFDTNVPATHSGHVMGGGR